MTLTKHLAIALMLCKIPRKIPARMTHFRTYCGSTSQRLSYSCSKVFVKKKNSDAPWLWVQRAVLQLHHEGWRAVVSEEEKLSSLPWWVESCQRRSQTNRPWCHYRSRWRLEQWTWRRRIFTALGAFQRTGKPHQPWCGRETLCVLLYYTILLLILQLQLLLLLPLLLLLRVLLLRLLLLSLWNCEDILNYVIIVNEWMTCWLSNNTFKGSQVTSNPTSSHSTPKSCQRKAQQVVQLRDNEAAALLLVDPAYQIIPSNRFWMTRWDWVTTINRVTWVQANWNGKHKYKTPQCHCTGM